MTKDALSKLWEYITAHLSNKANSDEVVYVDTENATTGTANPINADTLGGVAASSYVLKSDLDVTTSTAQTVSIAPSVWSGLTATVSVSGVTATNTLIVTYHPDSFTDASNASIYCSAQAADSLTFKCVTAPTATIKINVLILEGVK